MPRKSLQTLMREVLSDDDNYPPRQGHMWAIVTNRGLIVDHGELYGVKAVMTRRCKRWNLQHPNQPRWVVKVNMWWYER